MGYITVKETRLSESADIYKQREELTEKQKMQSMTGKQKWTYFNDYYRNKLIIGVAALGFISYIVYTILAPKTETILYAAIINDALDGDKLTAMEEDFASYIGMDPDNQELILNSTFYLSDETANSATMASEQQLVTFLAAGAIDVILTDEEHFKQYAENGYMENLTNLLPTDLYSKLSDSFYLNHTAEDSTDRVYGIYLDKSTVYKQLGSIIEKPVIGIIVNSKYKENSIDFIKYLFQMPLQ